MPCWPVWLGRGGWSDGVEEVLCRGMSMSVGSGWWFFGVVVLPIAALGAGSHLLVHHRWFGVVVLPIAALGAGWHCFFLLKGLHWSS